MLGSLGIDFTKWLRNARNEGAAQVGDAETIKITGKADVKQVIADLDKITAEGGDAERARARAARSRRSSRRSRSRPPRTRSRR